MRRTSGRTASPGDRLVRLGPGARGLLGLGIASGFVAAAIVVGQAWLTSVVVAGVFLGGGSLATVTTPLVAIAVLAVVRAGFLLAADGLAQGASARIKTALRADLTAQLFALGPAWTGRERSGELSSVLTDGLAAVDAYVTSFQPARALAGAVPLLVLVVVLVIDPPTTLVLLFTGPILVLLLGFIGGRARVITEQRFAEVRWLSAFFLDMLGGLATLKMFGRSREQVDTIRDISRRYGDTTMEVLRTAFQTSLVLEWGGAVAVALVAVEISLRLMDGSIEFGRALAVLIIVPEFFLPLRTLATRYHSGAAGRAVAERAFAILDEPRPLRPVIVTSESGTAGESRAAAAAAAPVPVGGPIRFEGVSVTYPGRTEPALDRLDLRIPPAGVVALVGATGAGKSTLASLLLRFIEPDAGAILVGDTPLAAIDPSAWRARLTWVPQRPHLFHGTVADTIRLARPDATDDAVAAAARDAGADAFIATLPSGYATPVGEDGAALERRPAPAARDRAGVPGRCPAGHPRRGDLASRPGQRGGYPRRRRAAGGDPGGPGRLAPVAVRRHRGPRRRARSRARRRDGDPGRARRSRRAVPAVAGRRRGRARRVTIFRRLFGLMAARRRWIAIGALLGFLAVGSNVALMAMSAYLISKAALITNVAEVALVITGVRVLAIARATFRYLERYVTHRATFAILADLRVWFFASIEPLAPAGLTDRRSGDLLARIVADIETLEDFYVRVIVPPVVAALVTAFGGILLGAFDPVLGVALVAFLVGTGVILPLVSRRLSRAAAVASVGSRGELTAMIVDEIGGIADLIALDRATAHRDRVLALGAELDRATDRLAMVRAATTALAATFASLAGVTVLAIGVQLVGAGRLDGVYLAVLPLAAIACFEVIAPLSQAFALQDANEAAARRLFELTDAAPAVVEVPARATTPGEPAGGATDDPTRPPAIEIRDLRFRYAPDEPWVLDGLSLTIPPGGSLALVGPSGSGKSTLVSLLLRFWEYEAGSIRIGGRELREIPADEVRALLGVVPQEVHLFNATIRDNLAVADAEVTDERIAEACRLAQVHAFIETLPAGYETRVGEHGLLLSGGERQRLAIARAIIKDAPILVLDEATANLDVLTERDLVASLTPFIADRTTLVISHRASVAAGMDRTVRLEERPREAVRPPRSAPAAGSLPA